MGKWSYNFYSNREELITDFYVKSLFTYFSDARTNIKRALLSDLGGKSCNSLYINSIKGKENNNAEPTKKYSLSISKNLIEVNEERFISAISSKNKLEIKITSQ